VPLEGQFTAHEMPGREFDRLTPGEDCLDYIGCQERQTDDATDLAGVNFFTARDLPGGTDFPFCQLVEPAMGPDKHGDRVFIGRCDFALRRRDDQLRFDTTALEYFGDGEFNEPFRRCRAVGGLPENHASEPGALESDMDRAFVGIVTLIGSGHKDPCRCPFRLPRSHFPIH